MERSKWRTYTYAQLDCKYDALCLKIKNTVLRGAEYMQYNSGTIKTMHFHGYGHCGFAWEGEIHKSNDSWVAYARTGKTAG
jgi:hypothetical protein